MFLKGVGVLDISSEFESLSCQDYKYPCDIPCLLSTLSNIAYGEYEVFAKKKMIPTTRDGSLAYIIPR